MGLTYSFGQSFPSWYPAVGEIVELTDGTTVGSAARADGANSHSGTDPDNMCSPWSGGGIVYIAGQPYMVVKGGGHGDSSYNGLVKFGPLYGSGSNAPTWSLFLAASDPGDVTETGVYSDGRQAATHTYGNLVGLGDALYEMATDAYYSGPAPSSDVAYKFTPAGQTTLATNTRISKYGAADYYGGKIYYIGANDTFDRLQIYDVDGNSWSEESNDDSLYFSVDDVALACDTNRGAAYATDGARARYWDFSDGSRQASKNAPTSFLQSVIFDPVRDVFVSPVTNSLSVRELDASAINTSGGNPSWSTRTFTGDTPVASTTQGIFGRFRYVPELKGYILVPTSESSVYFYRSS